MENIEKKPSEKDEKESFSLKREIFSWVEAIAGAIIVVALIITFVGRPILVDGHSMETTLMNNDRIVTTPLYLSLKHNDIVVVRRKGDLPLVKRVIALEGETVDFNYSKGEVTVNGKALTEPFLPEAMREPVYRTLTFPATVPEGFVFVMGDNRNNSDDSRDPAIGMIDKRNIMGKALFRIWPTDKMGKIDANDYTY